MSSIESELAFGWPDYGTFAFMFLLCILIGIYFGYFHASKNVNDYLVGGRSMSVLPVAISLVVSYVSGISLLGFPTEMYQYGMQYVYFIFCLFIVVFGALKFILPVYMKLQVTSVYEYMELRYDKSLRLFGSILFIVGTLLWLPIVVYVPSLAFNHATGINIQMTTAVVSIICIFYTCVGGIKAVVWTDFLQAFIMIGSIFFVVIKGTINVGGLGVVIQRNMETQRLELPDFDFSPFKRYTFWGLFFGMGFTMLQHAILNQVMMQRYMSLPSYKAVRHALLFFCGFLVLIYLMIGYSGLLIFARFYDCDPISTKKVGAPDQLLPLLVVETLKDIPGFTGIFLSGVFSASLSSLSSGLNSLAAVILEDCYKPWMHKEVSQMHANIVLKTTVIVIGCITVLLALVVDKLGPVLQLSMTISGITTGPVLGLYLMGIFLPFINPKGALYGGIASMILMGWLNFNAHSATMNGLMFHPKKPVFTHGCDFNFTLIEPTIADPTQYKNILTS